MDRSPDPSDALSPRPARASVPPGPWWWLAVGALLMVAAGTTAVAIWTAASSVCVEVAADGDGCLDRVAQPVWFRSDDADALAAFAALLAGVLVPLTVGYLARRWSWVAVAAVAIGAAAWWGYDAGDWATRQHYPDLYWADPWRGIVAVLAVAVGTPAAAIGAVVGVGIGRWRTREATRRRLPIVRPEPGR